MHFFETLPTRVLFSAYSVYKLSETGLYGQSGIFGQYGIQPGGLTTFAAGGVGFNISTYYPTAPPQGEFMYLNSPDTYHGYGHYSVNEFYPAQNGEYLTGQEVNPDSNIYVKTLKVHDAQDSQTVWEITGTFHVDGKFGDGTPYTADATFLCDITTPLNYPVDYPPALVQLPDLSVHVRPVAVVLSASATLKTKLVVHNTGAGAAANVATQIFMSSDDIISPDDVLLGSGKPIATIAAGSDRSTIATVTIPKRAHTRHYYFLARVDPRHAIAESNEHNNVDVGTYFAVSHASTLTQSSATSGLTDDRLTIDEDVLKLH